MFKVNKKDTRTTPMASLEAIVDACSCHFINKNYPAALTNNFFSVPRKLKIRRAKKREIGSRMFYITGTTTNIYVAIQTLLLMVIFRF